jgi:hypothetical protein
MNMTSEEKNQLKQFAKNEQLFECVKKHILDFGILKLDGGDAEIGARYRMREELKREIENKFKDYQLLN